MNGYIGVFDSGIGGLSVLDELKKVLPKENYIYYGDSLNNPYGSKTDQELYNLTSNIVDYLINRGCKIIVIACNTATTRCIKYLRNKYPNIAFVGTEPAIKVACDGNYKNILVLATPATVKSERTEALVKNNLKDNENIYLVPCDGLANAIENNNKELEEEIIKKVYLEYKDKDIDAIVLGCTHYPFASSIISKYFKGIPLLHGGNGVARETKRQLEIRNLLNNMGNADVEIINSKEMN